jgi:hypothetical protein
MEGSAFDRWTRRRFGRLAGSVISALLGWSAAADARKTRKRKKRCKELSASCTPGGVRKCCGDLNCDKTGTDIPLFLCCKREGQPCDANTHCCGETSRCSTNGCDNPVRVCCGVEGAPCEVDCDCCEGWNCECAGFACERFACKAP